jgi:hypothetical protein
LVQHTLDYSAVVQGASERALVSTSEALDATLATTSGAVQHTLSATSGALLAFVGSLAAGCEMAVSELSILEASAMAIAEASSFLALAALPLSATAAVEPAADIDQDTNDEKKRGFFEEVVATVSPKKAPVDDFGSLDSVGSVGNSGQDNNDSTASIFNDFIAAVSRQYLFTRNLGSSDDDAEPGLFLQSPVGYTSGNLRKDILLSPFGGDTSGESGTEDDVPTGRKKAL